MHFVFALLALSSFAHADEQLARGRAAVLGMTGCYLVDYNYAETESLKPGYERDKRVYDVTGDKLVKEWIYADEISENRVRLQHVLFAESLDGQLIDGAMLKHTGEEWTYSAPYLYEFDRTMHWNVRPLASGLWSRRVTNLDDGLRYGCASAWRTDTAYPEWTCATYAPIPGREYRDLGRRDYQGLRRESRVIVRPTSWLEREHNVKIIENGDAKIPLAKEEGKNWYVRIADADCAAAREFAEPRHAFWQVTREAWDDVLDGKGPFVEKNVPGRIGRYMELQGVEDAYLHEDLSNRGVRERAKEDVRALIDLYRD